MARIENDFAAAVVQARLVSTDFARLAEHPVLRQTISINTFQESPATSEILTGAVAKKEKKKTTKLLREPILLEKRELALIQLCLKFILTHMYFAVAEM